MTTPSAKFRQHKKKTHRSLRSCRPLGILVDSPKLLKTTAIGILCLATLSQFRMSQRDCLRFVRRGDTATTTTMTEEGGRQYTMDFDIYEERGYPSVSWDRIGKHTECEFLAEKDGPVPVIFMSLGRSGSFVTWNVLARMTRDVKEVEDDGYDSDDDDNDDDDDDNDDDDQNGAVDDRDPAKAVEITGRTMEESIDFFDSIPPEIGPKWAETYLCGLQSDPSRYHTFPAKTTNRTAATARCDDRHTIDEGIVGFQWKPYAVTNHHPNALQALRRLARLRNPRPRIVYLTRNPFDRKISNLRHAAGANATARLSPHCAVDDEECLARHRASLSDGGVVLPAGGKLLNWLRTDRGHTVDIVQRLAASGIPHVHVTYERLFGQGDGDPYGVAAAEWAKLLRLVGRGKQEGLTFDDVREHIAVAKTTEGGTRRKDRIKNFEEVKNSLKGTGFQYLLNG